MKKGFLPLGSTFGRVLGVLLLCVLGLTANSQIIREEEVLVTDYDLQSNSALGNRVALWNDGTAAFVVTMDNSWSTSFPDRGTGYNYFDGNEMGEMPEARIESTKSGWPSIAPLGDGEIIASHNGYGVNIFKRETKGKGEWEMVYTFEDWTWARIATTHNGQYVHVVFANQDSNTLNTALGYARSTDYGNTWSEPVDIPLVDNEGMYYNHLSADNYVMATNGDRVAILFVSYDTEVFYVYSEDNGETWSKQVVAPYPFGHALDPEISLDAETIWFNDQSGSIAIDNNGVVHVAFGLFHYQPTGNGYYTYWNNANGIVYWNSEYVNDQGGHEIPLYGNWGGDAEYAGEWTDGSILYPGRVAALAEEDEYTHLNLIVPDENHDGYVESYYWGNYWGSYRTKGMSTMPAISIDEAGNMIIAYSTLSETREDGEGNYYRSCLVTARDSEGNWFYDAINLSDPDYNIMHIIDEAYYVTAPCQGQNCTFWVLYGTDDVVGAYLDNNHQYEMTENLFYAVQIDPSQLEGWGTPVQHNHNVIVMAEPDYAGVVTGGGAFEEGEMATVIATAKDGFEFVNWSKNGMVVSTEPEYTFEVTKSGRYVANFQLIEGNVCQLFDLNSGWTWWTTAIELNGMDGLSMLENGLGESGVMITSQASGFVQNYGANGWYGSLESINNENMYRVKSNNPCTFAMVGQYANPADHPITVYNGWTYMGYMATSPMYINDALANLEASDGDIIKSQSAFANYYENAGWFGSLTMLKPGQGLMYKSVNDEEVTFTYPEVERGMAVVDEMADNNHWTVDMHDYEYNMTVMAVVEIEGNEVYSSDYELAAFADGVCRGSAKLIYVEPIDRYVAFLTIGGHGSEELSFGLYNATIGEERFDSDNSVVFAADAMVGDFDNPLVVNFRGNTGINDIQSVVRMYPNPINAGGCLTIEVADNQKVYVEIVDALGAVVAKGNTNRIMAPKTAGVYMLKVTVDGKATQIVKLIVR